MYINYRRLFNLQFHHEYFTSGQPDGLQVIPTVKTLKKLSGGKMLFKKTKSGITILYRIKSYEETPLVPFHKLQLRFVITVEDPTRFQTITDLDESDTSKKYSSANILYFKNNHSANAGNVQDPERLNHKLIDSIQRSLFTFTFSADGSPEKLYFRIEDDSGSLVSPGKDVNGDPFPQQLTLFKLQNESFRQQIDLRGRRSGLYNINLLKDENDPDPYYKETVFVDDELSGRKLIGILELNYETEVQLYKNIQEYSLYFRNREFYWKYLIVNKNDFMENRSGAFHEAVFIEDNSDSDPALNFIFIRQNFDPNDPLKVNGHDTVVFRSDGTIPFYEIPRASVQLKDDPENILIESLPNPSPSSITKVVGNDHEAEIYVYV